MFEVRPAFPIFALCVVGLLCAGCFEPPEKLLPVTYYADVQAPQEDDTTPLPTDEGDLNDVPIETDVTDVPDEAGPDSQTDEVDTPPTDDGPVDPDDGPPGDACQPDCANKDCGSDGCGSICGICVIGEKCTNLQVCAPECDAVCEGKFCGPDGCDGSCGTCSEGFECGADGKCYNVVCVPDCAGKKCGDDGCNGSCGDCVNGDLCVVGQCAEGPCSGIPDEGKCQDGAAYLCVEGAADIQNCLAEPDMMCGWNPTVGHYDCVDEMICVPNCTGKQCGDDGCGGLCGSCPGGWPCQANACEPTAGEACGYFNAVGKCIDNVLWYCAGMVLTTQNCGTQNKLCKFNTTSQQNGCL